MKNYRINTLHRYVGILIAPFLVIQTLSGLLLGFGLFRNNDTGQKVRGFLESRGIWDQLLVDTHFGPGLLNDGYHILLAAGIIWMAVSGWVLYLRIWRARRKPGSAGARGGQAGEGERP